MKLLFLDIDGTLFSTDGKILPSSILAMKQAQEKGVTIILASGRDYTSLPWDQLNELDIPYVITCNGSAVEEAKAAADDITASNDEDGVAKAIEKYLL